MQVFLKKHSPSVAHHGIKISWEREGQIVRINFSVQKRSGSEWLSDPVFTEDYQKNWGLWNKDVIEAFLQLRQNPEDTKAPYLELQVSPLNQPFALIITEPRLKFYAPNPLDYKTTVTVEGKNWSGTMEVKLPDALKGTLLYGGFFACLSQGPREFYALEPNPENNPDFHRPELFLGLDDL